MNRQPMIRALPKPLRFNRRFKAPEELAFTKYPDALMPAMVQDYDSGEALMQGWMDQEALRRTLRGPNVVFWSRSRSEYWTKGATSGNSLKVVDVRTDCDRDAILVRVIPAGPTCHENEQSCFCGRRLALDER